MGRKRKVLITGVTPRHCGKSNAFKGDTGPGVYSTVPHIFARGLEQLGHSVDMREVSAAEDISRYDRVFVLLGPINDPPMTKIFSGLVTLAKRPDAVILLNDWKVGSLRSSFQAYTRNRHRRLWNSPITLSRPPIHETKRLMRDEVERVVRAMGEPVKPWDRLVVLPLFPWGDANEVKGCPRSEARAWLDYSPLLRIPRVRWPTKKHHRWVCAALGQRDAWIKKHRLKWPIQYYGYRADRVSEDEVVQAYADNWGILCPRYPHSVSGWWRPRFIFSAAVESVLFTSDDDAVMDATDAYDYVAAEIENATDTELARIASKQARWFTRNRWTRSKLLLNIDALVQGTIETTKGVNRDGS
jgi:hypothetical protein